MCPASVIGAGLRPAFSPKSLVPAGHKMVPAAVRKGRHLSMRNGEGTSPSRMMRFDARAVFGSGIGTAERSDSVYG